MTEQQRLRSCLNLLQLVNTTQSERARMIYHRQYIRMKLRFLEKEKEPVCQPVR